MVSCRSLQIYQNWHTDLFWCKFD